MSIDFGKKYRSQFPIASNVIPINHGSYGLPPNVVVDEFSRSMTNDLLFPDKYMFITQFQEYTKAIKEISGVVGTPYTNLAIIPNATSGINIVFRSMKWKAGDKAVITSVVYDSCEHVLQYMSKMYGIEIIKLQLDFAKGDLHMLEQFEQVFKQGDITVCMFDMVSSMPAYLFPFEQLTKLCNKYDVLSVVDAAHGVGLVPFKIDLFKPDYLVSNLHKWYYCPRATAILYVDPKHHVSIQPFPISHVYIEDGGAETLVQKFVFSATENYAKLNCVSAAKKYRQDIGGDEKIWQYCRGLRDEVTAWLCERWDTKVFGNEINHMANIVVPEKYKIPKDKVDAFKIAFLERNTHVQFGYYGDTMMVRLSFQI